MRPLIEFNHVSKTYRLRRDRPTAFRDIFIRALQGKLQLTQAETLWALREVSFQITPGETVGFIGANGAGKSTALKLISRLIVPTQGQVSVHGRVSALLELGAGFHPDLSGRDNVFLSGSLIGMSRREVERKFDSIVAFSELGDYIDMPVKHYSSGMFARLAFATSIHQDPQILLVDEVLAVGDIAFQQKCADKISELKGQGVTILMVTHSAEAVQQQCTRALWLEHGRLGVDGPADAVVRQYTEHLRTAEEARLSLVAQAAQVQHSATISAPPETAATIKTWGSQRLVVERVYLTDAAGQERTVFETGQPICLTMDYMAREPIQSPVFGLAIHRQDGLHICGPNTAQAGLTLPLISGRGTVRYRVPHFPLLDGLYHLSVAIVNQTDTEMFDYHDRAYSFRVVAQSGPTSERYGLLALGGEWQVEAEAG